MIYVVSGYMRCGTSMMMEALQAGGLQAAYSERRDVEMNARWGEQGYVPNERYFELDAYDYRRPDFAQVYDGKLVKVLFGGAIRLPPGEYRCVFMRRPTEQIAQSLLAFFGEVPDLVESGRLDAEIERALAILRDRRSFLQVEEVWLSEVIENPRAVFERLGWPIDIEKAASVPNRQKLRVVV